MGRYKQPKKERISLKEAYGIKDTAEPVRPVGMDVVKAWLHIRRERAAAGSEDADVLDEIMDIIADYEAAKDMQMCQEAGVIRKDARTLVCRNCGTRVMLGDKYCSGCAGRLNWNLRRNDL